MKSFYLGPMIALSLQAKEPNVDFWQLQYMSILIITGKEKKQSLSGWVDMGYCELDLSQDSIHYLLPMYLLL